MATNSAAPGPGQLTVLPALDPTRAFSWSYTHGPIRACCHTCALAASVIASVVLCAGAYRGDDGASSSHHEPGRVKFGTAPRDAAEKIFISTEHEKTSGGRCEEGLGTFTRSAHVQLLSRSCCAFSMTIPAHNLYVTMRSWLLWPSRDSPGPSAYDTDSPGKRQLLSDRHREPAWSMGSGARSEPTGSRGSASLPGVGAVESPA